MAPTGETLGALIRRAGKIPVPDAVGIVRQLAERLAAIHATGTAHGNLRADDVQLLPRGPGEPPEVAVGGSGGVTPIGRPATVDDDVQTVGALLYEMICGMPPLPQADGRPAPPASLEPSVPVGVADALMQALDPDPARRPRSMSEIIGVLATSVRPEPRVQETLFMSPDQSAPIHREVMARTGLGVPSSAAEVPAPAPVMPAPPVRHGPAPAPTLIGGQVPKIPPGPPAAPGVLGRPFRYPRARKWPPQASRGSSRRPSSARWAAWGYRRRSAVKPRRASPDRRHRRDRPNPRGLRPRRTRVSRNRRSQSRGNRPWSRTDHRCQAGPARVLRGRRRLLRHRRRDRLGPTAFRVGRHRRPPGAAGGPRGRPQPCNPKDRAHPPSRTPPARSGPRGPPTAARPFPARCSRRPPRRRRHILRRPRPTRRRGIRSRRRTRAQLPRASTRGPTHPRRLRCRCR